MIPRVPRKRQWYKPPTRRVSIWNPPSTAHAISAQSARMASAKMRFIITNPYRSDTNRDSWSKPEPRHPPHAAPLPAPRTCRYREQLAHSLRLLPPLRIAARCAASLPCHRLAILHLVCTFPGSLWERKARGDCSPRTLPSFLNRANNRGRHQIHIHFRPFPPSWWR